MGWLQSAVSLSDGRIVRCDAVCKIAEARTHIMIVVVHHTVSVAGIIVRPADWDSGGGEEALDRTS